MLTNLRLTFVCSSSLKPQSGCTVARIVTADISSDISCAGARQELGAVFCVTETRDCSVLATAHVSLHQDTSWILHYQVQVAVEGNECGQCGSPTIIRHFSPSYARALYLRRIHKKIMGVSAVIFSVDVNTQVPTIPRRPAQ